MKKILAMLAAIVLCGAMMVSCNKDDNKNNGTQDPTKSDMTGTWEGSFQGTANIDNSTENYTINPKSVIRNFQVLRLSYF